jgi:hypothetical protein
VASPAAKIKLLAANTGLPPCRSMALPAAGPSSADTTSAAEKAANTVGVLTPRSFAIGTARMAGR